MAETVSNANRSSALQEKHANLERQIQEESNRPQPDVCLISDLKKRKLRIRDLLYGHIVDLSLKRAA